MLAFSSF